LEGLRIENAEYFMVILNILLSFGIFYDQIWYILCSFGTFFPVLVYYVKENLAILTRCFEKAADCYVTVAPVVTGVGWSRRKSDLPISG
jgi:hypothetical protein